MKKRYLLSFIIVLAISFLYVNYVSAIAALPDGGKKATGDYNLNDFIRLLLNVSNIIFALVGSLSLLAFIVGGVMFLTSSGNSSMVQKGKQTIIGASVGLVFVFSSFLIIDFVMDSMGYDEDQFGKWNETPADPQRATSPIRPPLVTMVGEWVYDPGIELQVGDSSPELTELLNCMRDILPSNVGRISSISDSRYIGNLSACEQASAPDDCAHSASSCHYGGGTGIGKSYAVDFGDELNGEDIESAAKACDSGAYVEDEGDHIHVSVTACPNN